VRGVGDERGLELRDTAMHTATESTAREERELGGEDRATVFFLPHVGWRIDIREIYPAGTRQENHAESPAIFATTESSLHVGSWTREQDSARGDV
jgi:hypothetical protein